MENDLIADIDDIDIPHAREAVDSDLEDKLEDL